MINFTQEEINLICMYDTAGRQELHRQITYSIPIIEDSDLKALAQSVLNKLERITDAEFDSMELIPSVAPEDLEE
ncbi:MAG: transposon-transfer assisting family protein [Clostridia bacterium]|nr:transposon-transfer assisting family protein [Clostridia bacterium]